MRVVQEPREHERIQQTVGQGDAQKPVAEHFHRERGVAREGGSRFFAPIGRQRAATLDEATKVLVLLHYIDNARDPDAVLDSHFTEATYQAYLNT